MKIKTLADLYLDQLQDMHSSESQIIEALPKMAKAAQHKELKAGFNKHLSETREQLKRLDSILKDLDKGPGRKVCHATKGLVEEGEGLIEADADAEVRDVGLICAAQKIEHYEIASYGCLSAIASLIGRSEDVKVLEMTLKEEKATDQLLTELALSVVNEKAVA